MDYSNNSWNELTSIADVVISRDNARLASKIDFARNRKASFIVLENDAN